LKKLLYIFFILFGHSTFAQNNALIINGAAYISLKGGTGVHLVVNAQANTGITRTGGGIINIDNNENDWVDWIIKTGAANNYVIPWMSTDLTYIPFTYTISTPSADNGTVLFSTWRTQVDNSTAVSGGVSGIPTGVSSMNNPNGTDDSKFCADRFWWVKYSGYTTKPTASMTFYYVDPTEIGGTNTITESDLKAQYWNNSSGWVQPPAGADVQASNYVNSVPSQSIDAPWVLVSSNHPLPIELLSFDAKLRTDVVDIFWSTASEINSDYFNIERTADFNEITEIATKDAAGMSNTTIDYYIIDENPLTGLSYYRLKEVDIDGSFTYSDWVAVEYNLSPAPSIGDQMTLYPNPANESLNLIFKTDQNEDIQVMIFDVAGKLVFNMPYNSIISGSNNLQLNITNLVNGVYFVQVAGQNFRLNGKFIKTN